jgi:hypothetical protein
MVLRGLFLSVLLLLASGGRAWAEGFRCPKTDRLIEVGDPVKKVVATCGQPASKEDLIETHCDSPTTCYEVRTGEIWTYDFGPAYLTRILYLKGGFLIRVDEGMYGKKAMIPGQRASASS